VLAQDKTIYMDLHTSKKMTPMVKVVVPGDDKNEA